MKEMMTNVFTTNRCVRFCQKKKKKKKKLRIIKVPVCPYLSGVMLVLIVLTCIIKGDLLVLPSSIIYFYLLWYKANRLIYKAIRELTCSDLFCSA